MAKKRRKSAGAFRYPISMRIDDSTDYMEIKVVEYKAPGLKTGSGNFGSIFGGSNFVSNTSTGNIRQKTKLKYSIILPIPNGVSDTNAVAWDEDSANALEIAGAQAFTEAVKAATLNGELNLENLKESAGKGLESLKGSLDKFAGALDENNRNMILNYFGAKAVGIFNSNVSAASLAARSSGQVLNPNMELLFKGPQLRTFPFNFTFTPRSRDESQMVKAIIRIFKMSMAAKTSVAGQTRGRGIFIASPDVFQITFKRGGKKHPFLFTMKPMALKGMNVNYSDAGAYVTYEDSTPVKMSMSLSFTELNPIYHEDYVDSFSSEGVGY